jgi:hypothetical protein
MRYRLALGFLVAVGLLVAAVPASAGPPETETTTAQDVVETFVDVVPSCEEGGPLYTITTTGNLVEHITTFDDGRMHETFTQTGTFVAVPLSDPSLPTFTGHFTVWGGFNDNGSSASGTFTFSVNGVGSDGSRVTNHSVEHFNAPPDGSVHEFFHCH